MTPRKPWPFPTSDAPPAPRAAADPAAAAMPSTSSQSPRLEDRQVSEQALDEAVTETFPASDPISVVASKSVQ